MFCDHFCSHVLQQASRRAPPHPKTYYHIHMQAVTAREAHLNYCPKEGTANPFPLVSSPHRNHLHPDFDFNRRSCWKWNTFTPICVLNVPNTFTCDWSLRSNMVPLCTFEHKLCSLLWARLSLRGKWPTAHRLCCCIMHPASWNMHHWEVVQHLTCMSRYYRLRNTWRKVKDQRKF